MASSSSDGANVAVNNSLAVASPDPSPAVMEALQDVFLKLGALEGFPANLIRDVANASSILSVMPEDIILRQGEVNRNRLYFLLIGSINVLVDDGLVATLKRKGDMLGEMGVISNKPCSATIIAKTPVELLCVDINEFKRITSQSVNEFDYIMYRIYSVILSDKVNLTNQKAKRLEETAADLQRAKTELQEINKQIERRVSERTKLLQSKLQTLLNDHLKTLREKLTSAVASSSAKDKSQLEAGLDQVDEVTRVLEPIVQTFALEVSMKTKRILLAQGAKQLQTLARLGLGGTGVQIESSQSVEQTLEFLTSAKFDVVLVDRESLAVLQSPIVQTLSSHFVYLATKSIPEQLPQLLNLKSLPNILFLREEDRAGNIRSLMTTITKLCSPNAFGVEKYLNVGADIHELRVTRSSERQELIQQMRDHFSKLGVRSSVLDNVSIVVEELLMNAIYDAPTDSTGNPIYNSLPRTTVVDLKPAEQSILRMATDGTLLGVSVEDPFGALTGKIILNYLDSCYGGRAGEMQHGKGGAGRGIHQIVENSEFVVFNVLPRRRTEALAFFDVVPGARVEKSPLLHYFCLPS